MQLSALQVNIAQEIEGGYNEYKPRKYSSPGEKEPKKLTFVISEVQYLLSCLFLLTILLGKIHGETIAKINKAITTKKGHQDATSIK